MTVCRILIVFFITLLVQCLEAQSIIHTENGGYFSNHTHHPPHSESARQEIKEIIQDKTAFLLFDEEHKSNDLYKTPIANVISSSFVQNNLYPYAVSAFYDHNRIKHHHSDFSCGYQSTDEHLGTDYFGFPFYWYQYEHELLDVVAAQGGEIIARVDNVIEDCSSEEDGGFGNYIIIAHSDQTQTFYGHLKPGTLLEMPVDGMVNTGDFLGKVGYSGNSVAGPHLHFETYYKTPLDTYPKLYDPYKDDECDDADYSQMRMERNGPDEYHYTDLLSISSHSSTPIWKNYCADNTVERPFFESNFNQGDSVFAMVAFRDLLDGHEIFTELKDPTGSTVETWRHTIQTIVDGENRDHVTVGYLMEKYILPADAMSGEWTILSVIFDENFRSVNSGRLEHSFNVSPLSNNREFSNHDFDIFPIPAKDQVFITGDLSSIKKIEFTTVTGMVLNPTIKGSSSTNRHYDLTQIGKGLIFVKLTDLQGNSTSKKIIRH